MMTGYGWSVVTMRPHDSQLAYQVMLYAIQAISDGDLAAINDLDLTPEEVQQLAGLNVKALRYLAKLSGHFLTIKTDHDCFAKMMRHLETEMAQESLIDELLQQGAPYTMLKALFGLSTSEFTRRQKLLGMPQRGAGRPHALDEETQGRVWEAWRATEKLPLGERYLALSRTTELPIMSLWSLTQSWERDYNLTTRN